MDRFAFYFLTHKYRLISKKGEGTFSEVIKAQSLKSSQYVAIKCMKNQFESIEQVNNLREIQALRRLSPHSNIVRLLEVLYDKPTGRLALCFELMDMNIYELIRNRKTYVQENRIKLIMFQVLKAVDHMHRNGIFHRDIKPENILILDDKVKVADYGSCRGIYSKPPYTEYISTRWYRAPECLLTDGFYDYKMDLWGIGCVFFEVVALFPLFPGSNELDQIEKIHAVMGTPPKDLQLKFKRLSSHLKYNFPPREGTGIRDMITHASPECVDLIEKLITYNPEDRITARQALRHPFFRDILEAEKRARATEAIDRGLSHTGGSTSGNGNGNNGPTNGQPQQPQGHDSNEDSTSGHHGQPQQQQAQHHNQPHHHGIAGLEDDPTPTSSLNSSTTHQQQHDHHSSNQPQQHQQPQPQQQTHQQQHHHHQQQQQQQQQSHQHSTSLAAAAAAVNQLPQIPPSLVQQQQQQQHSMKLPGVHKSIKVSSNTVGPAPMESARRKMAELNIGNSSNNLSVNTIGLPPVGKKSSIAAAVAAANKLPMLSPTNNVSNSIGSKSQMVSMLQQAQQQQQQLMQQQQQQQQQARTGASLAVLSGTGLMNQASSKMSMGMGAQPSTMYKSVGGGGAGNANYHYLSEDAPNQQPKHLSSVAKVKASGLHHHLPSVGHHGQQGGELGVSAHHLQPIAHPSHGGYGHDNSGGFSGLDAIQGSKAYVSPYSQKHKIIGSKDA